MTILKTGDKFSVATIDGLVEFTVGSMVLSREESMFSSFGKGNLKLDAHVTYSLAVNLSNGIRVKPKEADPAAIVGDM